MKFPKLADLVEATSQERGEAAAFVNVVLHGDFPRPISEPFPFHNHRTLAEVWAAEQGATTT